MAHKQGFYEKYIKRPQDLICASLAAVVLSPVMLVTAILVKIKLGSPVIFSQDRPGKDGKIFKLYKFRTMTDERDVDGNLLPDDQRLTSFGVALRRSSLDELPELLNIIKGDMAIVGPRPQLVRDMLFMTDEQRKRHTVRPGLSGLAQVNGRNAIKWEDRLEWDLKYILNITFLGDIKIILATIKKALFLHEGVNEDDMATSEDLGDYLLRTGRITQEEHDIGFNEAKKLIEEFEQEIQV